MKTESGPDFSLWATVCRPFFRIRSHFIICIPGHHRWPINQKSQLRLTWTLNTFLDFRRGSITFRGVSFSLRMTAFAAIQTAPKPRQLRITNVYFDVCCGEVRRRTPHVTVNRGPRLAEETPSLLISASKTVET